MKKTFITTILTFGCLSAFSQLKVNADGSVIAGTNNFSGYYVQLGASSSKTSGYNIGVGGNSIITGNGGISCGVLGRAKNINGMTYGVAGDLHSSCTAGAGIIGANTGILGYIVGGKYAGYFYGNTYVNGTLTATQVQQTSDRRLKENITPLSTTENSTLNKLLDINIVSFNYAPKMLLKNLPDSISIDEASKCTGISLDKKHIGLIAQELQMLYPDLVEEGQDGYLTVNYIELIPILIRSIQELNKKVEELENTSSRESLMLKSVAGIESNTTNNNILFQNNPNPFKGETTIRFSLAENVKSAAICIFDMTGKMLRKLPISSDESCVTVSGWELGEGMFLYSLIVNGKEIDTKRMIIAK